MSLKTFFGSFGRADSIAIEVLVGTRLSDWFLHITIFTDVPFQNSKIKEVWIVRDASRLFVLGQEGLTGFATVS